MHLFDDVDQICSFFSFSVETDRRAEMSLLEPAHPSIINRLSRPRGHPDQMPEPSHLTPLNAEEQ